MSGTLDGNMLNYLLRRTAAGESGGKDGAKNPMSSASGRYQITDGLWKGLQKNYPNAGLTDKDDPEQQAKGYALVMNNEVAPAFGKAGYQPKIGDYDAAWTFGGPRALQMRKAGDDAPIGSVLGMDAHKIIAQNPHYFANGANTTVGEVRNAISSAYDKAAGQTGQPDYDLTGAAAAQTFPEAQMGAQAGDDNTQPTAGSAMLAANPQVPDAPDIKPSDAVQNSPWSNVLSYLAHWGGGASQGGNFGETLGAGSAMGAKWLDDHKKAVEDQAKENENVGQANWNNKLKAATVRNAQTNTNVEKAKTASALLRSGFSAPNIVTLLNGNGGRLDASGMPKPGEGNQGTPKGFMDARYMKLTQPDGSEHNVLVSVNKDTGSPVGYDIDAGQPLAPGQMNGVFDPNSPDAANREKASNKAEEDYGSAVANGAETLNSIQTLKQILPHVPAGADFKSALSRSILNATGIPLGNSDSDSLALATKELNKLRIDYMNSARTPGMRTDIPMVKTMFGSVPDLSTATGPAIKTFLDENENMTNYKQKLWSAWQEQPDNVRRRGFTAFRTKYQSDPGTAYQPMNYEHTMQANREWYAQATRNQSAPQQAPTGTTVQPRVGAGSAPQVTGGWRVVRQ